MNPCVPDTHGATPKTPWTPLSRNSLRFRDISGDLIRGRHEAAST
jgi:hypothetical protein